MLHKIGDKVVIRHDLVYDGDYGSNNASRGMLAYIGCEAVITGIICGEYVVDIDDVKWRWTDEMFIAKQEVEDASKSLQYMLSLEKSHRDALAKQLIFDCAMELIYHAENIPDEALGTKILDALQALDKGE